MRKSLSVVAVLVVSLAACYDAPPTVVQAGPFGVNLSGTWVLTSITGTQPVTLFQPALVPLPPVALGPLPFITSAGSKASATTPNTRLDSATMTMLYDVTKDWTAHLYYTRTDAVTGAIIVSDSVHRGQYYTTTDVNGATSITILQNLPINTYYTGIQPSNGGVSKDAKTITVQSGLYAPITTTIITPVFAVSTTPTSADASGFTWVWTKK